MTDEEHKIIDETVATVRELALKPAARLLLAQTILCDVRRDTADDVEQIVQGGIVTIDMAIRILDNGVTA